MSSIHRWVEITPKVCRIDFLIKDIQIIAMKLKMKIWGKFEMFRLNFRAAF